MTASDSIGDVVDQIDQSILSLRSFITGLGIGSTVGAGIVGFTDHSLFEVSARVTFDAAGAETMALRRKNWEAGLTVAFVVALCQHPHTEEVLISGIVDPMHVISCQMR